MRIPRIVTAKVGMDGHDRGVKVVSTLLREAGFEVVYLGKMLTAEGVVQSAIQEAADAIGLSFLSGEHVTYTRETDHVMREKGLRHGPTGNVKLFVGGVFPNADVPRIRQAGADEVFIAGTLVEHIVPRIRALLRSHS